jgi:hypothetical protein
MTRYNIPVRDGEQVHRSWFAVGVLDFVGWAVVLIVLLKFVQIHPYYRCMGVLSSTIRTTTTSLW